MGKYMTNKGITKVEGNGKHIFKVNVNIHGNRHTEKYSIDSMDLHLAQTLNLLQEDSNGYIKYLDWKPIAGDKKVSGGVKQVLSIERDKKYIYVVTEEAVFSLPKYLEKEMVRKDVILFGKREY